MSEHTGGTPAMRGAVISTDAGLRDLISRMLAQSERGIECGIEITVPFTEIHEEQVAALRRYDPEFVVVDFDQDPATGINLARFLADGHPHRRLLAVGPSLGSEQLLEVMRAGVSEYLPQPVGPSELAAAIERIARKLGWTAHGGAKPAGQLYAIFSPKGGSGTTTVATNLAIVLHRLTGKRALLVDLDLELGEVAVLLGVRPRFSFLDMVRNYHRMDTGLLSSFIEKHESGVHLLSAPFVPEPGDGVPGEQIRAILSFLKQHYDFIVVDTSKSFSLSTVAAFDEADRVFLVTNVDLPSLRNIQRCVPLLERIVGRDAERLRLIVNRFHAENVISLDDVRRTVGLDVYWTLSNDYGAVIHSINSATPIVRNGKSRYARDLRALGADIAGLGNGKRGKSRRDSLMGRVLERVRGRSEESKV